MWTPRAESRLMALAASPRMCRSKCAPGYWDRSGWGSMAAQETANMKPQLLIPMLLTAASAFPQALPVKWEELTAADFQQAIEKAQSTCLLPFGIVEQNGPRLPL